MPSGEARKGKTLPRMNTDERGWRELPKLPLIAKNRRN